jgi:hypothetical protein
MKIYIVSFLILISFTGCFETFDAKPSVVERLNSDTQIKVKYVKYVGDAIVDKYDYSEKLGIVTTDDFRESHLMGSISVPAGAFLARYTDMITEESYYCGRYSASLMSSKPNNKVCFIESDNEIHEYYILLNDKYKQGPYQLSTNLAYKKSGKIDMRKRFRKIELIYDGMYNGMLLFTYREFMDSPTKPSFYSKIRYRKRRGVTTFTYKSATIKVYRANPNKIEYVILSPLRFNY